MSALAPAHSVRRRPPAELDALVGSAPWKGVARCNRPPEEVRPAAAGSSQSVRRRPPAELDAPVGSAPWKGVARCNRPPEEVRPAAAGSSQVEKAPPSNGGRSNRAVRRRPPEDARLAAPHEQQRLQDVGQNARSPLRRALKRPASEPTCRRHERLCACTQRAVTAARRAGRAGRVGMLLAARPASRRSLGAGLERVQLDPIVNLALDAGAALAIAEVLPRSEPRTLRLAACKVDKRGCSRLAAELVRPGCK